MSDRLPILRGLERTHAAWLDKKPSLEEVLAAPKEIATFKAGAEQAQEGIEWFIGELIVYAQERFDHHAEQLEAEFENAGHKLSLSTWDNYARAVRRFPRAQRVKGLGITGHVDMAADWIPPEEREKLRESAAAEGWTRKELRAAVRVLKERMEFEERGELALTKPSTKKEIMDCARRVLTSARPAPAPHMAYMVSDTALQELAIVLDDPPPPEIVVEEQGGLL